MLMHAAQGPACQSAALGAAAHQRVPPGLLPFGFLQSVQPCRNTATDRGQTNSQTFPKCFNLNCGSCWIPSQGLLQRDLPDHGRDLHEQEGHAVPGAYHALCILRAMRAARQASRAVVAWRRQGPPWRPNRAARSHSQPNPPLLASSPLNQPPTHPPRLQDVVQDRVGWQMSLYFMASSAGRFAGPLVIGAVTRMATPSGELLCVAGFELRALFWRRASPLSLDKAKWLVASN